MQLSKLLHNYYAVRTSSLQYSFEYIIICQFSHGACRMHSVSPTEENMLTSRFSRGLITAGWASALVSLAVTGAIAGQSWSVGSEADWKHQTASANQILFQDGYMVLDREGEGEWTGKWHDWQATVDSAEMFVEADIDLFDNKTIEVVVKGAEKPYTDASGVQHDWYGRCMIAIVDENRWIMAIRSGTGHIHWGGRDTVHLLTSANEGRSWSGLNQWFDGTPIEGMPYEDGATHSEPGLYRMPNGDLILQFWRTDFSSGTKQLRSTDNGKTWIVDIDRIYISGITRVVDGFALGTEDWLVDPENPSDIYMAFQHFHYPPEEKGKTAKAGSLLARSEILLARSLRGGQGGSLLARSRGARV